MEHVLREHKLELEVSGSVPFLFPYCKHVLARLEFSMCGGSGGKAVG